MCKSRTSLCNYGYNLIDNSILLFFISRLKKQLKSPPREPLKYTNHIQLLIKIDTIILITCIISWILLQPWSQAPFQLPPSLQPWIGCHPAGLQDRDKGIFPAQGCRPLPHRGPLEGPPQARGWLRKNH